MVKGFQTVKAILPDRAAGRVVGVAVGWGGCVGAGVSVAVAVGVGPVALAVGVLVLTAEVTAGVPIPELGVDVVRDVAVELGVLTMMGVQVGVGPWAMAVAVVPGAGITSS